MEEHLFTIGYYVVEEACKLLVWAIAFNVACLLLLVSPYKNNVVTPYIADVLEILANISYWTSLAFFLLATIIFITPFI